MFLFSSRINKNLLIRNGIGSLASRWGRRFDNNINSIMQQQIMSFSQPKTEEKVISSTREKEWNNPDGASDPESYVQYLDGIFEGMSSSGPAMDYKRTVYELMDIHTGDSIVDIGCGTGVDVMAIADLLLKKNIAEARKKDFSSNDNNNSQTLCNNGGSSDTTSTTAATATRVGGKVFGIDISDTMVRAAQKKAASIINNRNSSSNNSSNNNNILQSNNNENNNMMMMKKEGGEVEISFQKGNAENLENLFPSSSSTDNSNNNSFLFDICRCDRSLQHIPNPQNAIKEMIRITKPGTGKIIISEPDWETLVIDSPSFPEITRKVINNFTDTRINGWMGRQLPRIMKLAGIQNIQVFPLTSPITNLEFIRKAYLNKALRIAMEEKEEEPSIILTEEEGKDWMEELISLDNDGLFFSTLTIYVVRGTVPV